MMTRMRQGFIARITDSRDVGCKRRETMRGYWIVILPMVLALLLIVNSTSAESVTDRIMLHIEGMA
jgi:hypothetical protein